MCIRDRSPCWRLYFINGSPSVTQCQHNRLRQIPVPSICGLSTIVAIFMALLDDKMPNIYDKSVDQEPCCWSTHTWDDENSYLREVDQNQRAEQQKCCYCWERDDTLLSTDTDSSNYQSQDKDNNSKKLGFWTERQKHSVRILNTRLRQGLI